MCPAQWNIYRGRNDVKHRRGRERERAEALGIYNVIEKGSNGEKFIGFVFMEPKLNVNYPHETDGISFYI